MPSFNETQVRDLADLHRGDHIAVDRVGGAFKHHMIVIEDPIDLRSVSVIQYTNDVLPGARGILSGSGKSGIPIAKVRRDVEDISSDVRKGRVYRIDNDECFSPDETVQRASSKLGEGKYSPLTNNCEHFATWCKTGRHGSSQIDEFLTERAKEGAKQAIIDVGKAATRETPKATMTEGAKSVAKEGAKQVAKEGTEVGMKEAVLALMTTLAESLAKEGETEAAKTLMALKQLMMNPSTTAQVMMDKETIPVLHFMRSTSRNFLTISDDLFYDIAKESWKQVGQEGTKTVMKEGAKSLAKEGTKQVVKEGGKTVMKEGSKSVAREGGKTVMKEGAKSVAKEGTKQVAKEGGKTVVKDAAKSAAKESAKVTMKEGSKAAVKSGGKSFGEEIMENQGALGIGITVVMEGYEFWNRWSESKKKRVNWEISQSQYEKEMVTHAVKGVANGTATVVGATVGQTIIPIPFVGGMVGAMGGKAAVWFGGKVLGSFID